MDYNTAWLILACVAVAVAIVAVIVIYLGDVESKSTGRARLALERDIHIFHIVEAAFSIFGRLQQLLGRPLTEAETDMVERVVGFFRMNLDRPLPTLDEIDVWEAERIERERRERERRLREAEHADDDNAGGHA